MGAAIDESPVELQALEIEETIEDAMARSTQPGSVWLWCLHCNRFFQARHLRVDFLGNRQRCAFCEAAGFEIDVYLWNEWSRTSPAWPTEAELHHGLVAK